MYWWLVYQTGSCLVKDTSRISSVDLVNINCQWWLCTWCHLWPYRHHFVFSATSKERQVGHLWLLLLNVTLTIPIMVFDLNTWELESTDGWHDRSTNPASSELDCGLSVHGFPISKGPFTGRGRRTRYEFELRSFNTELRIVSTSNTVWTVVWTGVRTRIRIRTGVSVELWSQVHNFSLFLVRPKAVIFCC